MKVINPYRMFQGAFIPNAIMECRELSQSAKLMWGRLAQYAGKDGRCFPKISTLADDIGLSRSGARKVLNELRDKLFIHVKVASGKARMLNKPNEYFFLDHPVFHSDEMVLSGGTVGGSSVGSGEGLSLEGPKMDRPIEENHLRESGLKDSLSGNEFPDGEEKKKKKKKYWGSDEDHRLARKIYEAVLVVNQTVKEPSWDRWANDIRLMRQQDKRSYGEIWRAFDFANRDPFWCGNVLSPGALRRNYSRLAAKAGMVQSRVRGAVDEGKKPPHVGRTCGECEFANKGKPHCAGQDAIPGHKACNMFTPVEVVA